jgi:hypothetical protein
MAESIKACLIPDSERTKKTINLTKLHITAREYFMHITGVRQKHFKSTKGHALEKDYSFISRTHKIICANYYLLA